MALKDMFKKPKYVTVKPYMPVHDSPKRDMPEGLWHKCNHCGETLYVKDLERNLKVCEKCGFHFRLSASERIGFTLDENSFEEWDAQVSSLNPLEFPGYEDKIREAQEKTGLKEAVVTGKGTIEGQEVAIGIMDANFIMASMGSAVGEKLTRMMERALEQKLPVVVFSASGGARMHEGILSLMQMAKTSGAVAKLNEAGLLYISVLTDPTTGGVTASFASVGDINIAEQGALIGFAGPRVIEQTIRQKLPTGFQKAEFHLQHGFVDMVLHRAELKQVLADLISLHQPREVRHG